MKKGGDRGWKERDRGGKEIENDAEKLQKGLLKPGMWTKMNASLSLEKNKKKGKRKRAAKKEGPEKKEACQR